MLIAVGSGFPTATKAENLMCTHAKIVALEELSQSAKANLPELALNIASICIGLRRAAGTFAFFSAG